MANRVVRLTKSMLVLTINTVITSCRHSLEGFIMEDLWLRLNLGMLRKTMNLQFVPRYFCLKLLNKRLARLIGLFVSTDWSKWSFRTW